MPTEPLHARTLSRWPFKGGRGECREIAMLQEAHALNLMQVRKDVKGKMASDPGFEPGLRDSDSLVRLQYTNRSAWNGRGCAIRTRVNEIRSLVPDPLGQSPFGTRPQNRTVIYSLGGSRPNPLNESRSLLPS